MKYLKLKIMENKIYKLTENELSGIIQKACEEGMLIQRTINDKYDIPATRIKKYIDKILNTEISEPSDLTVEDKKPDNFICQKCGNMETDKMCSKYCLNIEGKNKKNQKEIFGND